MNWFALYTKPRNEKKVTEGLLKLGIEAYCPTVNTLKQWSDRKKKVAVPVLPSYVFVKIEEQDRNQVFQIPGVVRFVFWLGKPAHIREIEIQALKDSLQHTYTSFQTTTIQKGTTITLSEGPFKGQQGIVKFVSTTKTKILLESLGLLLTLEY